MTDQPRGENIFAHISNGYYHFTAAEKKVADYVLSRFSPQDQEAMEEGYEKAVRAAEMILAGEVDGAMNEYNRKVKPGEN